MTHRPYPAMPFAPGVVRLVAATVGEYADRFQRVIAAGSTAELTTGPIHAWRLDEASGPTGADAVASLDMTHQAGVTAGVSAQVGNGASYDGNASNGFSTAGTGGSANFERTDPFSLSLWFQFDTSTSTEGVLVSRSDGPGTRRGWLLGLTSAGQLYLSLVNTWSSNAIQVESPSAVYNNGDLWHIVVTYDGSSNASGVTMYANGAAVGALSVVYNSLSATMQNASAETVLGAYGRSGNYAAPTSLDLLDDVAIFDYELTAAEALVVYNLGSAATPVSVADAAAQAESGGDVSPTNPIEIKGAGLQLTGTVALSSRQITRHQDMKGNSASANWSHRPGNVWRHTASGGTLWLDIEDLPDGAVLDAVSLRWQGESGHSNDPVNAGGTPITMPAIELFAVDEDGTQTSLASTTDTNVDRGDYESAHDITVESLAHTIDRTANRYMLEVTGEGGTGFVANAEALSLRAVCTVTEMPEV